MPWQQPASCFWLENFTGAFARLGAENARILNSCPSGKNLCFFLAFKAFQKEAHPSRSEVIEEQAQAESSAKKPKSLLEIAGTQALNQLKEVVR